MCRILGLGRRVNGNYGTPSPRCQLLDGELPIVPEFGRIVKPPFWRELVLDALHLRALCNHIQINWKVMDVADACLDTGPNTTLLVIEDVIALHPWCSGGRFRKWSKGCCTSYPLLSYLTANSPETSNRGKSLKLGSVGLPRGFTLPADAESELGGAHLPGAHGFQRNRGLDSSRRPQEFGRFAKRWNQGLETERLSVDWAYSICLDGDQCHVGERLKAAGISVFKRVLALGKRGPCGCSSSRVKTLSATLTDRNGPGTTMGT